MPKTEFTPQELKNYFSLEPQYCHCFYKKSVERAEQMCVHADGIYPERLLNTRRPNEPLEVMEYRKSIFVPKTKPYFSKIISSLQKIRRSSDWSIRYEGEFTRIAEGETLKEYCEENFGDDTSVTNWVFSVFLKKYLVDPNAVLFVYPKEVNIEQSKYLEPVVQVFDSCHVLDYVANDFAVLVNPAGCTYATSKGVHPGKSFYVVTTVRITRYDQVDGRGTMMPVIDYEHGLEELPVYKIGAVVTEIKGDRVLYESRISGIIPEFDEAIREYSDLQAAKVIHMYPERWEFTQTECSRCNGTGKIRNPAWYEGCGQNIPQQCGCDNKGCTNGYVVAGPYSKIMVRPMTAMEGQASMPTPPAGYVEKDVEIIKVQEESVVAHITNGLASINFEFIATTPLSQSGVAKEVDKDELNNTVHSIAEDIVRCMDWMYWIIAKYRYQLIYSEDDIKDMVPHIAVPEKYDILSSKHLEEQLKSVKDSKANPVIVNAVEAEYANKAFNNDPSIRELVELTLRLDPLANIPEDDRMSRLSNGGITKLTYVISSNIHAFVQRALQEDKDFVLKAIEDQQEVIRKYAQEQLDNETNGIKVDMPDDDFDDPTTPLKEDKSASGGKLTSEDIGKIPLALQQLALAKQRSLQDGDIKLADEIEKKMKKLIADI
jgi:hypothetical protein